MRSHTQVGPDLNAKYRSKPVNDPDKPQCAAVGNRGKSWKAKEQWAIKEEQRKGDDDIEKEQKCILG